MFLLLNVVIMKVYVPITGLMSLHDSRNQTNKNVRKKLDEKFVVDKRATKVLCFFVYINNLIVGKSSHNFNTAICRISYRSCICRSK